jgi:hypothetical protein
VYSSHLFKSSCTREPETNRHNIFFATAVTSNCRGYVNLYGLGDIIVIGDSELSYDRFINIARVASECMMHAKNNYAE